MAKLSLQERLVRYLRKNPYKKFAKGELCDLARDKMGVTGETVGRRLRVLAEVKGMNPLLASRTSQEHVKALELLDGGTIEVEHRDKNHCWYWYVPPLQKKVRKVKIVDGRAVEYEEIVSV